jgi:alkylation response protein AidB-like acyl-CoA dehydrogenase
MDDVLEPEVAERLEQLLRDAPPGSTDPVDFLLARFDAGLAWVHYPDGRGGMGADPSQQRLVARALTSAGAADPFPANPIGIGMVGPTIAHHGTDEQVEKHLRRLWSGQDVWCQLFSEPGAGSDLADLATRAVPKDDGWVVHGQKVWTSMADRAQFGLLLARTDVDLPKNKGITAFLVDMHSPGVEVRPLRQMTGDAEFNEVFFDGAVLPEGSVLGPQGQGWHVAFTTLMNERASIGDAFASSGGGPVAAAMELYRRRGGDAAVRDRVTRMWIEAELVRLLAARAGEPGPAGSIGKLLGAEHTRRVFELTVDLLGPDGMLLPDDGVGSPWARGPQVAFLRSRAATIEGGTSEVMRNILAERVLGLPREDLGPRERAWKDIPRS